MAFSAKTYVEEPRGGGSKIPVGIHSDVSFEGLKKDTGWWDLVFSNSTGRSIHKRLFNPDASKTREVFVEGQDEKVKETPAQALERQQAANFKHVVYVMRIVTPEAVEKFTADTYDAFMAKASKLFETIKGIKVHLKVLPDYKDLKYPEISSYTGYLELNTGGPTTLEFSKKESISVGEMLAKRENDKGSSLSDTVAFPGPSNPGELPF